MGTKIIEKTERAMRKNPSLRPPSETFEAVEIQAIEDSTSVQELVETPIERYPDQHGRPG